MGSIVTSLLIAFALGFVVSSVLSRLMRARPRMRIALVLTLPLLVLLGYFLVFTDFAPASDEWIWMGIGITYFAPWYGAWLVGWLVASVTRRLASPAGD